METIETTVYRTVDGKDFTDKATAEKHEAAVIATDRRTTFWCVTHNPDLTEGRGWYGRIILEVVLATEWDSPQEWVEDYCHRIVGRRLMFVQGCSAMAGWQISRLDSRESAEKALSVPARVGDYDYPAKWVKLCPGERDTGLVEKTP